MEDIYYYDPIMNHFILFNISFNLKRNKIRKKEKTIKRIGMYTIHASSLILFRAFYFSFFFIKIGSYNFQYILVVRNKHNKRNRVTTTRIELAITTELIKKLF
jgi:hypothetical protein